MPSIREKAGDLSKMKCHRVAWKFYWKKSQSAFIQDGSLSLRPISKADMDFYVAIRAQYSLSFRVMLALETHKKEGLFLIDTGQPEEFFCIIETGAEKSPIGYIGIKDTRTDSWEFAIELDGQYIGQGYGSESIRLFLNEVHRITGKADFQARVDTDNLQSQKSLEKIGAKLVGLCDGPILKLPEEKKLFEDKNLNLIDDHMRELADKLNVDPKKLLSHMLDYRVHCPL